MEVEIDHRRRWHALAAAALCVSRTRFRAALAGRRRWRSTRARYSRISSSRCVALLVGELEKDLLAFRVLEALAVALEEAVRAALAPDADHQRLPIVDALGQLLGAGGEQAVGGAFEKQERRPRLELRILLQQLLVARLQRAQMLLLFLGQLLEDAAAAGVLRHPRARANRTRDRCARWRSRCAARRARTAARSSRLRPPARGRSGRLRTCRESAECSAAR